MGSVLWIVASLLVFALLVFSTYAAFVGFAGVLSGARYAQCPSCHHHYLSGRIGQRIHTCPRGATERAYQAAWAQLHNAGVQPH
jgi:hypothetical protein